MKKSEMRHIFFKNINFDKNYLNLKDRLTARIKLYFISNYASLFNE